MDFGRVRHTPRSLIIAQRAVDRLRKEREREKRAELRGVDGLLGVIASGEVPAELLKEELPIIMERQWQKATRS